MALALTLGKACSLYQNPIELIRVCLRGPKGMYWTHIRMHIGEASWLVSMLQHHSNIQSYVGNSLGERKSRDSGYSLLSLAGATRRRRRLARAAAARSALRLAGKCALEIGVQYT